MHSPDVLIVGAGPAGSSAALTLARAGVRVCLIDRQRFPRHKLCGDTLNPGCLALLEGMGMLDAIRPRALRMSGMVVTGPAGAAVAADYPAGLYGLALTRHDLDAVLVDAAVAAGACFRPSVTVTAPVVEGGRVVGVAARCGRTSATLRARLVVAADGRASRLGSALALSRFAAAPRRWACGAYYEGVDGITTRGEMHIRRDGYIGIAPLPGGVVNVCVVRDAKAMARGTMPQSAPVRSAGWHASVLEETVAADPVLRDRFARARRVSPVSVLGPLATVATASGRAGMLLAGDAAGFIDPMTGDGMRFALRGGQLAGEAAFRELQSGRPAHGWLDAIRAREFGGKWRVNRLLRTLVGSPRALDAAAFVARRWTAPVEYLIGVAGDVALARR